VSGGVFASGMFAKEDAVTWEIHVFVRLRERWVQAREDRSRNLGGVEVGGPNKSEEVGEGEQATDPAEQRRPVSAGTSGENHDVA